MPKLSTEKLLESIIPHIFGNIHMPLDFIEKYIKYAPNVPELKHVMYTSNASQLAHTLSHNLFLTKKFVKKYINKFSLCILFCRSLIEFSDYPKQMKIIAETESFYTLYNLQKRITLDIITKYNLKNGVSYNPYITSKFIGDNPSIYWDWPVLVTNISIRDLGENQEMGLNNGDFQNSVGHPSGFLYENYACLPNHRTVIFDKINELGIMTLDFIYKNQNTIDFNKITNQSFKYENRRMLKEDLLAQGLASDIINLVLDKI